MAGTTSDAGKSVIVANRVDADGNLAVRLPGEGSEVVSVDARLLGVH